LTITREGCGSGQAKGFSPGEAHELALKAAETDATKRALATFGNPFGLALYDRELSGVKNRKALVPAPDEYRGPWLLSLPNGVGRSFSKADEFIAALRQALTDAPDVEQLFAIWERNVDSVRAINKQPGRSTPRGAMAQTLVSHMKLRAIALAKQATEPASAMGDQPQTPPCRSKVDKSVLAISEPKRVRSKEHLRFVANQPCLICGRTPAHAHHVRYAQPRGVSLKVSDEFTVPLCAIHHSENHATGDERRWWQERAIDPIAVARSLWRESSEVRSEPQESPVDQRS
jgi:hypothetical protein